MSIYYRDKNGSRRVVAGMTPGGDLAMGASTTRSGTISCEASSTQSYCQKNVTFADPMPDGDYIVEIQPSSGAWEEEQWTCVNKSANGFTFVVHNINHTAPFVATTFYYNAFKLYEVSEAEQNASDITTIKSYIPATTTDSNKLVNANEVDALLDTKQDELTFDNSPTVGSDNPVKSGGIKAALDAKQNTLTFDTTPTASSSNPVTSDGIKDAIDDTAADIYEVMGKNGAKNLLPIEVSTQTISSVTYTISSDGTMDIQGQNTSGSWISLNVCSFATLKSILSKYKGKQMIFSITSDYDYDTRNVCLYYNIGGTATYVVPNPKEKTFTVPNNIDQATSITVPVGVNAGETASTTNLGIMLRLANDADSNYAPYAMTNRELTEHHTTVAKTFTQSSADVATYLRNANTSGYIALGYSYNRTMITVNAIFSIKASGNALYKSDGTTATSGNENWELIKIPNFPYSKAVPDGPLSGLLFLNLTDLKDLYCRKSGNDLIFTIGATDYASFVGKGIRLSATIMLE